MLHVCIVFEIKINSKDQFSTLHFIFECINVFLNSMFYKYIAIRTVFVLFEYEAGILL